MKNKIYIAKWTNYFAVEIEAKNEEEAEKKWQKGDFNKKDIEEVNQFETEVIIEEK